MSPWLNVAGLIVNLLGVILLFRFGMPYRVRTDGYIHLIVEQKDSASIQHEKRYSIFGAIGLISIIIGTGLQIIGSLV